MATPPNLGELFDPVAAPQFLMDYFGVAPLHSPGAAGRFVFLEPARQAVPCSCGECAVCSPASGLAWSLERDLEAPVIAERVSSANIPEPRRGERDAIVLQIAGRTEWNVYGNAAAPAAGEPGWSALLEAGGALYLPRACWRSTSCSQDPGASSWFFHVHNPTGAGLLQWLADKVKDLEVFQADVPRFASPAAQAAYLTTLRKAFGWSFRMPSLLEAYARRLNRLAPAHPLQGEPWSESLSAGHWIALSPPRYPRIFRRDRETVCLAVGARELLFPADAAQLLQYLFDKAPVAMDEFYRQFEGEFDREELASFLAALSRDEVISMLAPELAN